MQTLKQFLQTLSYKRNKTVKAHAKGLLEALQASKVPEKLQFYVITDDDFQDEDHKQFFIKELEAIKKDSN